MSLSALVVMALLVDPFNFRRLSTRSAVVLACLSDFGFVNVVRVSGTAVLADTIAARDGFLPYVLGLAGSSWRESFLVLPARSSSLTLERDRP